MGLTKAQEELLREMENDWEVTFRDEHYTMIKGEELGNKLWPSTFYGLFDQGLVEKTERGTYTISYDGKEQIRSEGG
jgi:hypothetical protein